MVAPGPRAGRGAEQEYKRNPPEQRVSSLPFIVIIIGRSLIYHVDMRRFLTEVKSVVTRYADNGDEGFVIKIKSIGAPRPEKHFSQGSVRIAR